MSRIDEFKERIDAFKNEEAREQRVAGNLAFLRVLTFVVIITFFSFATSSKDSIYLILCGLSVILFSALIGVHRKVNRRISIFKRLQQVNQQEIDLLELRLNGLDGGNEFNDKEHNYSGDLDVFGNHSLFQLINRTATQGGRKKLAELLLQVPDRNTVIQRQKATKELSEKQDWRQRFQVIGRTEQSADLDSLKAWLDQTSFFHGKKFFGVLTLLYPLIPFSLLVAIVGGYISPNLGVWSILGVAALVAGYKKVIDDIKERTSSNLDELKRYLFLIKHIESENFESPALQEIKEKLVDQSKASAEVEKLRNIFVYLEGTNNAFFFGIAHTLFAWDYQWIRVLEAWKKKNKDHLIQWLEAVTDMDVAVSVAGFAYNQSDNVYPVLNEESYSFKAEDLAHPLIPSSERIGNDFQFKGEGQVVLITGSNMSGKSTFMRTVGVNVLLANIGAPVCARSCELSVMSLYTSMRTSDSIEESTSSFYAELRRIERLIQLANKGEKVLFVLDEILKGTNSKDRHDGAEALIKQLIGHEMTGFVSTHDLELTNLENELDAKLVNYSFNSNFEKGKLLFDYKVNKGACQSFNASQLMKSIGINFDEA